MKQILPVLAFIGLCSTAKAQITITAADMPVAGDTLRFTAALPLDSTVDLSLTGPGTAWDFSSLTPVAQGVDAYKSATQVNITYGLTISPSAYGYKIADSLPGLPLSVKEVYNFFNKKSSPSRYVAEAFAAKVNTIPIPINYSDEDEWYFFPLNYTDQDSSSFKLSYTSAIGSFSQQGSRETVVDGWGTIKTPYYTTPASCIRVVSEINEIDSIVFSGQSIGLPRHSVEYKWLVNGEHYPALWITTNVVPGQSIPTSVRYRDSYKPNLLGVPQVGNSVTMLNAYPNPAINGHITLEVPAAWKHFSAEVFDMQGKLALAAANTRELNLASLPSGQYIVRVISGSETGYVQITK